MIEELRLFEVEEHDWGPDTDTKQCSHCKRHLPHHLFHNKPNANAAGERYVDHRCKTCKNRSMMVPRQAHRDGTAARLYIEQGGKCKTCGVDGELEAGPGHSLCIDHDHATGRVRGLLCVNCNQALGKVKEDILTLAALIAYILDDPVLGVVLASLLEDRT